MLLTNENNIVISAFVRGAPAFSFFIYHTRCSLFPCFDCFPIGAKKHTHSLNERETHTHRGLWGVILSWGVFILRLSGHSFVIVALQASVHAYHSRKACSVHSGVCVFGNCMLQRISSPALTARLLCIMNAMMRQ